MILISDFIFFFLLLVVRQICCLGRVRSFSWEKDQLLKKHGVCCSLFLHYFARLWFIHLLYRLFKICWVLVWWFSFRNQVWKTVLKCAADVPSLTNQCLLVHCYSPALSEIIVAFILWSLCYSPLFLLTRFWNTSTNVLLAWTNFLLLQLLIFHSLVTMIP